MEKLTIMDLIGIFMGARHDHPGRRGSVIPRRGAGHFPRFRQKRNAEREALKQRARNL